MTASVDAEQEVLAMRRSLAELMGMAFPLVFAVIMGLAVAVSLYQDGVCLRSLFMLGAWLAATGILWSIPFIFQRFGRRNQVYVDERGLMILKNSLLAAHTVSWFYFLLACLVAWSIVGPTGSVSVNVLPLIFVGWVVIFQFALVVGSALQDRIGEHRGQ
jgi:hypothetical protein